VFTASLAFAAGGTEETAAAEPFELEVIAQNPEYEAVEQQLWEIYEEENPNVTVTVSSINEDQTSSFMAKVAAGDVPHISYSQFPEPDAENYTYWVDLRTIDYPYWDELQGFDPKSIFKTATGVDYVPGIPWIGGRYIAFIYHEDEMKKAGLNPRETVRSWADMDAFLAEFKKYVDSTSEVEYVLDQGWNTWFYGKNGWNILGTALGGSLDEQEKLFRGEIAWTDVENNPLVPAFQKWKEYTQLGYLPERWWARDWENEHEASFIGRKSILTMHGPWIWQKVETADPNAQLTAFPIPTTDDVPLAGLNVKFHGTGIYAAHEDEPYYDQVVDAFIWAASPEIMKLRCEGHGYNTTFDLSEYGGLELQSTEYKELIGPLQSGYFGDIAMDFSLHPVDRVAAAKVPDTPYVLYDDSTAQLIGRYMSEEIDLEAFLAELQSRWERAFDF
jgi:ABC-type glycerol-3-phosphate transport system substrate-binding protein